MEIVDRNFIDFFDRLLYNVIVNWRMSNAS